MTETLRVTVPDKGWLERLADLDGRVELIVWDFSTPQPEGRIDLAVSPYRNSTDGIDQMDASRLGVLQLQTLGYDGVADVLPAGITCCNAVGVHEGSTAELAVALLLASQREIDAFARERGEWNRRFTASLLDRRIMLLGYGGIGTEVEKRLEGFEAELVRVAGHRREDERGLVHGNDELAELLPTVDAVIVAVPLSDATSGLIGGRRSSTHCRTARSSSTSRAARSPTPTLSYARPAGSGMPRMSRIPSRCPLIIRSGTSPAC